MLNRLGAASRCDPPSSDRAPPAPWSLRAAFTAAPAACRVTGIGRRWSRLAECWPEAYVVGPPAPDHPVHQECLPAVSAASTGPPPRSSPVTRFLHHRAPDMASNAAPARVATRLAAQPNLERVSARAHDLESRRCFGRLDRRRSRGSSRPRTVGVRWFAATPEAAWRRGLRGRRVPPARHGRLCSADRQPQEGLSGAQRRSLRGQAHPQLTQQCLNLRRSEERRCRQVLRGRSNVELELALEGRPIDTVSRPVQAEPASES